MKKILLRLIDGGAYVVVGVVIGTGLFLLAWGAWIVIRETFGYLTSREGEGLLWGLITAALFSGSVAWLNWRRPPIRHLCDVCDKPAKVRSGSGWLCSYHGRLLNQ